jgi:type II secretory pathway pseudopilin PulG
MKRGLKSGPKSSSKKNSQAGFTLIELAISLIVIVEVLLGVLLLFDFTNKLSHAQTNIADMQSTLRIAEAEMESTVRMAGRGGLKFFNAAPGKAIWVRDNVLLNPRIGDATSPQVVPGTDVLTVRGVFTAPIYQVNFKDTTTIEFRTAAGIVTGNPAAASTGTLKISNKSPTNIPQDLQPLADSITADIHEALVLVSSSRPETNAVVELIPNPAGVTTGAGVVTQVIISFRLRSLVPTDLAALYNKLGTFGNYPDNLTSVSAVGLLEEHRFYIRDSYAIANNAASDPTPKLTRARFMPGTDVAYGPTGGANSGNLYIDVADNILDLQVALGLDTINHIPVAGEPAGLTKITADRVNGYISEAANGVNDDWLYNSTADNVAETYTPAPPAPPLPAVALWLDVPVYFARVTLVARTDRRDPKYEAPVLGRIEDRTYLSTDALNLANDATGSRQLRQYRRRVLQTVIDVRNNV